MCHIRTILIFFYNFYVTLHGPSCTICNFAVAMNTLGGAKMPWWWPELYASISSRTARMKWWCSCWTHPLPVPLPPLGQKPQQHWSLEVWQQKVLVYSVFSEWTWCTPCISLHIIFAIGACTMWPSCDCHVTLSNDCYVCDSLLRQFLDNTKTCDVSCPRH